MINDSRYDRINKLLKEANKCKVWCKHCGQASHTFTAGKFTPDKAICPNCGYYIYKNEKIEFEEKLRLCMLKN